MTFIQKSIFKRKEKSGISAIGIGEADAEKRIEKAVEQALSTSLIEVSDISSAYGMLIHIMGDAGMNAGAHLPSGVVVVLGTAGEFAGACMKSGTLILKDAKGFLGENLKDGFIYAKKKIIEHLGIGHVEAMSYHKYGIVKE
jgi:formylmethanofuran dehydrogenase subunit C